jgi:hypothetical protein
MGLAIAAIAAAAIGAGATAYAATSSSAAAKDAAAKNASNAEKYRKLEERLFHEGRGSQGFAILPEYGGDFEKQLFQDAAAAYKSNQQYLGTPEEQIARNAEIVNRFQPAFEQGSDVIDSVYSGEMQRQQLAEAQPVMQARTALAQTQRQGINDSLQALSGRLAALNAQKGWIGTGTGYTNAQIRQSAPLYQQAAGVGALANLQNAQQTQGIYDANRQLQLNSLGLPGQRAQQALALKQLPFNALNQITANSQVPFGMFKIPIGQQNAIQLPTVQPIPGAGQIAAAGVGQLASAYGGYAANQALINQMNQMNQAPAYNPYQVGQYDYSPVPAYGGGYYG